MSDKPIRVGDLVMVVRGHECYAGYTFTVVRADDGRSDGIRCGGCNKFVFDIGPQAFVAGKGDPGNLPVSWLKRIDPPTISEDVPTGEEIHA